MHICFIVDNPETPVHPVIGPVIQELRARHTVRLLDVRDLTGPQVISQEALSTLADLYLLKSHAPQALDLAHTLEEQGTCVVNSWAATLACQDRKLMAERMSAAHLPWPRTWSFATLGNLLGQRDVLGQLPFPLILKSAYSHRGDLVRKVQSVQDIATLTPQWSQEPVVLQEFVPGDGWDQKLWVIDQHLFAASRRTPLDETARKEDIPLKDTSLPADWRDIAFEIGRVFDLRLYGVDLLITERGPVIVDVNSFPGFRGVPGAVGALVGLIERLGEERKATK
jgi:ribosomal protein S6--L-glutamate ligase